MSFPIAGPKSADLFAATQQRPLRAFHVCEDTLPLMHTYVERNFGMQRIFAHHPGKAVLPRVSVGDVLLAFPVRAAGLEWRV